MTMLAETSLVRPLLRAKMIVISQKCTHLACVVFWQTEEDRLYCPCHEGEFDPRSGDPTAGPPERPLERIDIEVRDGVVWALGAPVGEAPSVAGEDGS